MKIWQMIRSHLLWLLSAGFLGVLFFASSTDLLITEQSSEVSRISVILDDVSDVNYENFRKGAEQAALELRADVRFITLYEAGSEEGQRELVLREQEDGAEALIISAMREREASEMIASQQVHIPVIFLRGDVVIQNNYSAANLNSDYYVMGRKLAETVTEHFPETVPVYYISTGRLYGASRRYLDGAESILENTGYRRERSVRAVNETKMTKIRRLEEEEEEAVLIALDRTSLLHAMRYREAKGEDGKILGLYGPGTGIEVLSGLERGLVDGICITDDYAEGYLAVSMAAARIGHHNTPMQSRTLEGHYIEKTDLEEGTYERILYPME